MSIPAIGTPAPDFTLAGTAVRAGTRIDDSYTLSAERGRPVVLAFYPGDARPICTAQLCSYQEELDEIVELGATVWAIGPHGLDSHEEFAREASLTFPLLADVNGDVAEEWGLHAPIVGVRRSVFIVGPDGLIRWRHVGRLNMRFPSAATIREHLDALVP